MEPKRRYVAVAGTIGAGKTSLTAWLVKRYGFRPFYEPNDDNPYLADFYADMKRWALQSQLFFLAHKIKLHQELDRARAAGPVVIDRTVYEDAEIFARNLHRQGVLDKRDFGVYYTLYEGIRESLRPPDLLIALTCSLRATKRRIQSRGRAMESAIPDAYLRRLHRLYEEWFEGYTLSPIVRIDTTDLDYVENLVDLIELQRRVDEALA
ncbi:MAG: deoxynucleoside kinase [Myxococcales bacterium]|nr:deoxynucleoside kinase [Myxococcales bacterium]MBL0192955.1 deoxynucleoside kinase [Myxococcales bacterium]HQY59933.1 deoxynucleoside kinase [Polyangiaceae bacterium]